MFANIKTVTFQGIDASIVDTQVQISKGLCCFNIVGLPDKVVAESKERIRSAFSAIGLSFPDGRITVNLAPADLQKEGSHFDLPITLGIMCCMGIISEDDIANFVAIGELSLDGSISKVAGALPTAILASSLHMGLICPFQSGGEAAWASDIEIIAPKSLIALLSNIKMSSVDSSFKTNTLHLESKALLISKDGFSVVAPIKIIEPFSTNGKKASCWALLNL